MPRAYYNERDPHAAAWIENLIAAGAIAAGDVDTRDIRDVRPSDLYGYTQCHFFAGIGVWSKALRSAGVPDDQPVWTGSCPCQPFSVAGQGMGFDDERHLWPDWHWLIEQCRPPLVFGEQVASADGLDWADLVQADLEAADYAWGPADTCAAGFRSFHIRQRLYFVAENLRSAASSVAYAGGSVPLGQCRERIGASCAPEGVEPHQERQRCGVDNGCGCTVGGMGEPESARPQTCQHLDLCAAGQRCHGRGPECASGPPLRLPHASVGRRNQRPRLCGHGTDGRWRVEPSHGVRDEWLANAYGGDACAEGEQCRGQQRQLTPDCCGGLRDITVDPADGYWRDADWLLCRDGKWRPAEPGTFPLAHAALARVGRLRAYGNALDLAQATGFVRAYLERDVGAAEIVAGNLFEWGA